MTYPNVIKKWIVCPLVFCLSLSASHISAQQEEDGLSQKNDSTWMNLEEEVEMGFIKESKRNIVGAVSSFKPQDHIKYDHTQSISGAIGNSRITGLMYSNNIRGLGEALIIVDGIPGRDIGLLNTEEVESITVLKDANAIALYGAMAKNGVILVTTKRGQANNTGTSISANFGLSEPVRLPEYLGSAEYMTYYNQAYRNDGKGDFRFDPELEIPFYRDGTNPYKYPDVDFFSDEYLKRFAFYTNVLTEFYGGNEGTRYYVNVGFNKNESLLKFDEEQGNYRFNVRGNVDFKINKWISSSIDAVAIFNRNHSSQANFWEASNSFRPNLYAPLLPVSMIDYEDNPELEGIVNAANKFNGNLLGAEKVYEGNTPFGDIYGKGYNSSISRVSQVNNSIDFNLNGITEGLSAKTYASFDFYNSYRVAVTNDYRVYEPTWDGNQITGLELLKSPDKKGLEEKLNTDGFVIRYGFYGLINYEKELNENHSLNASLIGFLNNTYWKDEAQSAKNAHVALNFRYGFRNKLLADFSGAYINSVKLAEGNRGALSPTFGLAYVLSEDVKLSWMDYFKIRASMGFIRHDQYIDGYYLYSSVFERDWNSFAWGNDNSNETTKFNRGQNLDLRAERRKDLNVGFEAGIFKKLFIEANYFQTDYDDLVTLLSVPYPSYYNAFRPYSNYNAVRGEGFELGANYVENLGDFSFNLGARLLYISTENLVVDEIHKNDFQYRKGKSLDAIFGHTSLGFYEAGDFDEAGKLKEGIPVPQYGSVKPGDLKYLDKDGDGFVNDDDMHEIGNWWSPWNLGTDLTLRYKNFTLFTVISGDFGSDGMKGGSYYRPQGDNKYSEVVRGAWTEATASTATFPRLSTENNNNNFSKNSTFWMYDKSSVSINRVQLTYEVPQNKFKNLSVFVAGSNLARFAKHKKELETRPGNSPLYRYYTTGLRITF